MQKKYNYSFTEILSTFSVRLENCYRSYDRPVTKVRSKSLVDSIGFQNLVTKLTDIVATQLQLTWKMISRLTQRSVLRRVSTNFPMVVTRRVLL